jgi:hypothetical protein
MLRDCESCAVASAIQRDLSAQEPDQTVPSMCGAGLFLGRQDSPAPLCDLHCVASESQVSGPIAGLLSNPVKTDPIAGLLSNPVKTDEDLVMGLFPALISEVTIHVASEFPIWDRKYLAGLIESKFPAPDI